MNGHVAVEKGGVLYLQQRSSSSLLLRIKDTGSEMEELDFKTRLETEVWMIAQVDKEASEIWRSIALFPTEELHIRESASAWGFRYFCSDLIDRKNVFKGRFIDLIHPRLKKMFGRNYSAKRYLTERRNENKS